MPLHLYLYSLFRRQVLCRLGRHGKETASDGSPANFCEWGCGHAFNPVAFRKWEVTLNTGEIYEVEAVNEYHAGSKVVYGDVAPAIDERTGAALAMIKVHRGNIASVTLKS
jgi:hypothetical protein